MEYISIDDPVKQFLLLCLRTRVQTTTLDNLREFVFDSKLNWDLVEQRIREKLLAPVIFTTIAEQEIVPLALEKRLHNEFITCLTGSTYQLHQLWKVIEKMQSSTIEIILLKGAALSLSVYRQDSPRFFGDLDLVVKQKDVNKALGILTELEYRPTGNFQPGAQDLLDYTNQWQLTRSGYMDVEIDLHWHLFSWIYYQYTVPQDWFWQTSIPVEYGTQTTPILGPEAQLIHLSVHLLQHHRSEWADSLRSLHDIAEVIINYQDQLDWDLLISKIEEFQLIIPIKQVLLRVWRDWQIPILEKIVNKLNALIPSPVEVQAINQLMMLERGADSRFTALTLRSLPTWQLRLQYIFKNLLFPSTGYMRQRYNIRYPLLLPFYYPHRWWNGVVNFIKF